MNNDTYRLTLRRIDERWHVVAIDREDRTEHTHYRPHTDKGHAYDLRDLIKESLEAGHDLNLRHWSSDSFT